MTGYATRSGRRRLPLREFTRVLTLAIAVATVGLAVLVRGVPMTGRMTLVVAGPSMTPAIAMGSAIIVEPVAASGLTVGDVVSIRNGPTLAIFTHRIVRLVDRDGSSWLETKGDANAAPDPAIVPVSAVLGRVVVAIPYAGYLVALGSRPSGMVLIIGLELLLLVAGWLMDPKRAAVPAPLPA